MKLVSVLAVANAALAVLCALLGAAPFTPAPIFLVVLLPLAALFAYHGQTAAALAVVLATAAAILLSPVRASQLPAIIRIGVGSWLVLWSLAVLYFSRQKLLAFLTAIQGGGAHGA